MDNKRISPKSFIYKVSTTTVSVNALTMFTSEYQMGPQKKT